MAEYVLFYSWQSDEKRARYLIEKALKRVVEKFKKSGINLILSQDSRGQKGAQNISMGILKLINKANMFLADLTPVTSYTGKEGLKLCPNSNVMFEYGYAMRALGEDRCTQYVFLKKDWNMALMPFDINQRTTLLLKEADLEDTNEPEKKGERNTKFIEVQLENWILGCIEDINEERRNIILDDFATISFEDNKDEIIINPPFKRINYTAKPKTKRTQHQHYPVDNLIKGSAAGIDWREISKKMGIQYVKPYFEVQAKNTTVYDSRIPIKLVFSNKGKNALDNVKISISLPDDSDAEFYEENEEHSMQMILAKSIEGSIFIDDNKKSFYISINTINSKADIGLETVYLLPPALPTEIQLKWEMNSRNYSNDGTLTIKSEPIYEDEYIESDENANTTKYCEKVRYL